MATPRDTLWSIEPHTLAKHEILRRYLQAWFPILSRTSGRIIYLDGFCGPGRYKGGEPGSPVIALLEATNHQFELSSELVFWFIDERQDRIEHLQGVLEEISLPTNFRVTAECGRFRDRLAEVLDMMDETGSRLAPTFAFVDPFGFSGIPYSLIERLLRHRGCEAFIYFGVDSINRFLTHPNPQIVQDIVETFGTTECLEIAKMPGDRIRSLRSLYQRQLARVARFVRVFEMRDHNDRPLYDLFFAGNHPKGFVKIKEAMWPVDPHGEFRFSDATNPDQLVFLEPDTIGPLCDLLRHRFAEARHVQCGKVERFVENETAFLGSHMRAALRRGEDEGWLVVDPVKADGKPRRAGTFPAFATLTFVHE